jgi:hypothetical protein
MIQFVSDLRRVEILLKVALNTKKETKIFKDNDEDYLQLRYHLGFILLEFQWEIIVLL